MKKKLVVFPNDALLEYFNKGEIKERYFNPLNWFDEVHVISLFDNEIESNKVKQLAGEGTLFIHKFDKVNLSNYKSYEKKITNIISEINPMIIRSFNSRVQGWLATKSGKKLNIPVVVSLHTNPQQQKQLAKKQKNYLQYLKLFYSSQKIEKFVLEHCDEVICVYDFIVPFAKKMKAKNISVIHNKVDLQKFVPDYSKKTIPPTIISVGRLISQKQRFNIIKAIKNLDVNLLIIGDGPDYDAYEKLIDSLELNEKIKILKAISNDKLPEYYTSSDIFALELVDLDGIPIPFFEAMACGIPVVSTKHSNDYSEITDDAVSFVDNNPDSFEEIFTKILDNEIFRKDLQKKSLEIAKQVSIEKLEEKELQVYQKLISSMKK